MAVVFQGIEGEKKGRMVIGCASVLRLGHGNTKTLLSFFPNNIGAKHFLRAKTLNSSNLTTICALSAHCAVPHGLHVQMHASFGNGLVEASKDR